MVSSGTALSTGIKGKGDDQDPDGVGPAPDPVYERNCSVARVINILSDAWSFLIIRESFFGARRFDQFQSLLGLPRATLAERLKMLTQQEILRKVAYVEKPLRHEYRLTERGFDLYPSMIALLRFGDKWLDGHPRIPVRLRHKTCGHVTEPYVACSHCGGEIRAREVSYREGPGAGETLRDPRRKRRAADPNQYDRGRPSAVSRTLQIIGDRWTFMVARQAFFGVRRFDEFQNSLRIAPNILTDRLNRLVAQGILIRQQYQRFPDRFEYRLTEMGLDLYGPFLIIMQWGDRWLSGGQPPILLTHKTCGHDTAPQVLCNVCHQPIAARDMSYLPNYEMDENRVITVLDTPGP